EEYPGSSTHPPQFVLNGWMEVLSWLNVYHERSGSMRAKDLLTLFGAALEGNIGKYDVPSMSTSLYKLSEIAQLNFLESVGGELEIRKATVKIPGVGTYPISVAQEFDDRLYKNVFFGPSVRTSDNGSSSFR
ncbi:D-glucuronyl C5-epimerase family protein, partial [Escherichia coli]|uniref:D-glucuronyl C5-epimerase family protein n=1 Tax=Escherichia coli TaxID=562 RepID=UPI00227E68A1